MPADKNKQQKVDLSASAQTNSDELVGRECNNIVDLAAAYPRIRVLVNIAGAMITLVFLISLFAPLFTLEKFFFFSNTVSLASGLKDLLQHGEILLFTVIFAFSILFPLFKLGVMFFVWNSHAGKNTRHWLKLIHQLGKWSMLDVFVVALLVVSIKFKHLAEMQVHYGLTLFLIAVIASILLTMVSMQYMQKHCTM